ncbi:MAG TPA: glycosyltransferase [Chthoniobacterales bacterium]|nr:glycosyltransferase [Chthoniobacterales bacterium]
MYRPITAIVTAHTRVVEILTTLKTIQQCDPAPEEIIVHVDGNQERCEQAIRNAFPEIQILRSKDRIGPGGARNKLIAAARNDIVASFDDDSYPLDKDYFARVQALSEQFTDASILAATVYERGDDLSDEISDEKWASDFSAGGCVFRRSCFLPTNGFVPLPMAYGMEEVDLALRLHAGGQRILRSKTLRVYHDTDLRRHSDSDVTAASIANLALLAYLRYPLSLAWLGVAQIANRIRWLIKHRRWRGIFRGLIMIPGYVRRYRHYRQKIRAEFVRSYVALRHIPVDAKS